ncbi:MAG: hypothetical protein ACOC0A_04655 [Planctomycetota bacterium]
MKRMIAYVIGVAVIALIAVGFLWFTGDSKNHKIPVGGREKGESSPTDPLPEPPSPVEMQEVSEVMEAQKQRIRRQYKDPDARVIQDGRYVSPSWWDKKSKTTFSEWKGAPADTPGLKMRFMRRNGEGELEPVIVVGVSSVNPFNGFKMIHSRKREIGSLACNDPHWDEGSYAAVVPLAEKLPCKHSYWLMGQTYGMTFRYRKGGEEATNMRLVRMPENVPPGKMAVIEVDVTKKQDKWWHRIQGPTLKVQIAPEILTSQMSLYVWDKKGGKQGRPRHVKIGPNGRAKIKLHELGGDLRLASSRHPRGKSRRVFTFPVWYVKSVNSRKITLPEDASLAISAEDVVQLTLEFSKDMVPDDSAAVGLLASRRSHLSLCHHQIEETPVTTVPMEAPPGEYFVAAYSSNSSAWGKPSAVRMVANALEATKAMDVIGKVTIEKSDAGKTIEVEPLEE